MLEVRDIIKMYSNNQGVKNISFKIEKNEIVGILGPNGAGKTTTMDIIAGLYEDISGECFLDGMETTKSSTKKNISYLMDEPYLYENLTIIEFINFYINMKKCRILKFDIKELIVDFGLKVYENQKISTLSFGMKKKVALIASLVIEPKLLILDEPTNGLDTKSLIELKKYLNGLKQNGCIILISSHIIDFLNNISDRILFINNGIIIKDVRINKNTDIEREYIELFL